MLGSGWSTALTQRVCITALGPNRDPLPAEGNFRWLQNKQTCSVFAALVGFCCYCVLPCGGCPWQSRGVALALWSPSSGSLGLLCKFSQRTTIRRVLGGRDLWEVPQMRDKPECSMLWWAVSMCAPREPGEAWVWAAPVWGRSWWAASPRRAQCPCHCPFVFHYAVFIHSTFSQGLGTAWYFCFLICKFAY